MSGQQNVAPAAGAQAPVGYLWCNFQGTILIGDWLRQEGLEYEVFYASFLVWCEGVATRFRVQQITDEYEDRADRQVLWGWPAPAIPKTDKDGKPVLGMICLMSRFLKQDYIPGPGSGRHDEQEILKMEERIYNCMFTEEDRKTILEDPRLFAKPARRPFALSNKTKKILAEKERAANERGVGFASTFGAALPSGESAHHVPAATAPAFAGPSSLPFRARGQGPIAPASVAPASFAPSSAAPSSSATLSSFPLHIKGQGPVALAAPDEDDDDDDNMID